MLVALLLQAGMFVHIVLLLVLGADERWLLRRYAIYNLSMRFCIFFLYILLYFISSVVQFSGHKWHFF